MYNLKTSRLVAPHRGGMPLVSCLPFTRCVLEDDLGSFKYFDGQRMRSVLANGLQETRDQRCADDLEL